MASFFLFSFFPCCTHSLWKRDKLKHFIRRTLSLRGLHSVIFLSNMNWLHINKKSILVWGPSSRKNGNGTVMSWPMSSHGRRHVGCSDNGNKSRCLSKCSITLRHCCSIDFSSRCQCIFRHAGVKWRWL